MSYYGAGGNAFGGFPSSVPITNIGLQGVPPTLGANLPPVDPNNLPGTVHFGPSVTQLGQVPPGVNYPNWNAGASGGADFYPGY